MKTSIGKILAIMILIAVGSGCVSVKKHELIRERLRIEQTSALKAREEITNLKTLIANLNINLDKLKTERDKLRVMGKATHINSASLNSSKTNDVVVGSILFASGQESLSEKNRTKLKTLADNIKGFKNTLIVVQGHSDPTPLTKGKYRSNMHLSTMRALVVYHELLGIEGVEPANCVVEGRGEFLPGNRPEKELRRVDIIARSTDSND